jgi:hypothetical protein
MQTERSNARDILDCGGKRSATPLSHDQMFSSIRLLLARSKAVSPLRYATAIQDAGTFVLLLCLATVLFLTGCASSPRPQIQRPADSLPADALITQRGVLTVLGRQFTLNGYLASSATNGQRLIITENFGGVLADVLVKPDGKAHVMRSSRAFKPRWIERYIAADVRCLFGNGSEKDCPGQMLGPNHFRIERRWYKLDLHIVETKPGLQPLDMFAVPKIGKP